MKQIKDSIIGIAGCLLATNYTEEVSMWVSIICSALIALTTCFVQAYRLWRDRDNDKKGGN